LPNPFSFENKPHLPKSPWFKVLFLALSIQFWPLLILGVIVVFVNYTPEPEFWNKFHYRAYFYTASISTLFVAIAYRYPHPISYKYSEHMNVGDKVAMGTVATLICVVPIQFAIMEGVPYLLSYTIGTEGSVVYTVENSFRHRKGCGTGVNVKEIDALFLSNRVCHIRQELFEVIGKGDEIIVYGIKTPLGIRVSSVTLAKE